ncbi:DUF3515 family protein [Ruania alba]|uniref:DUF3515 domain-containing protein n=1 Tax=Ruania alba TaxID=648782 RepID=A0A1H5HGC7_9MICO|nr:DUF3515 family protein [Ruania alba]SEE27052.1 Protein of unknown function [Ruania alba]
MPVRTRVATAATTALLVLGLAACGAPVEVEPAPEASTPVCAEVLRSLPDELAGAERRSTTSQASAAWGDPAITFRCGVPVLGPTTDRCITAEAADGTSVDWVVAELGSVSGDAWQFTTYGRSPAIELVVPVIYAGEDPTTLLVDIGEALTFIEAERECLALDDTA